MSAIFPTPDSRPTPPAATSPSAPSTALPSSQPSSTPLTSPDKDKPTSAAQTSPSSPAVPEKSASAPAAQASPASPAKDKPSPTAIPPKPKADEKAKDKADPEEEAAPALERLAQSTWERLPVADLRLGIKALRVRSTDLSTKLRKAVVVLKRREREHREERRLNVSAEIAVLMANGETAKAAALAKEHGDILKSTSVAKRSGGRSE